MDLSIEAIEADLSLAEINLGRPLERLALARAHIRALLRSTHIEEPYVAPPTLYANDDEMYEAQRELDAGKASPEQRQAMARKLLGIYDDSVTLYAIDDQAPEETKITQAATILGLDIDDLRARLSPTAGTIPANPLVGDLTEDEAIHLGTEAAAIIDDPGEVEIDDDVDEDFFAEARKEHRK